jgi:hypothetical protein
LGRALLARLPLQFLPLCLVLDVFRIHAYLSLLGWTIGQSIHHRGSCHSERSEEFASFQERGNCRDSSLRSE